MSDTAVERLLDVTQRLENVLGQYAQATGVDNQTALLEASHRVRALVLRQRERQRALHAKAVQAYGVVDLRDLHYATGIVDTLDWVLGNPVVDGPIPGWLEEVDGIRS